MRRRSSSRGFTLVETLVAMLIVALLSAAIATGTGTALRIHGDALFVSESEILASTVNTALGDVLHYAAYEPEASDGDTTAFTNRNYGVTAGHFLTREGRLYLNASQTPDDAETATLLVLLSDGAYTNLEIRDFTLDYDTEEALFTGSYVIAGGEEEQRVTIPFAFRPVNG